MQSAQPQTILRYPSPLQWFADHLAQALLHLGYVENEPTQNSAVDWLMLPDFVLDSQRLGTIATPLPLKLAGQVQGQGLERRQRGDVTAALKIGQQLITQLLTNLELINLELINLEPGSAIALKFSAIPVPRFWMHPNGWLYAEFSDEFLSQWLQLLMTACPQVWSASTLLSHQDQGAGSAFAALDCAERVQPAPAISDQPIAFGLQYAHARCCSLLRLGQQARLIQFGPAPDLTDKLAQDLAQNLTQDLKQDLVPDYGCLFASSSIRPSPIPWQTKQGVLRLQTASEQALIRALMQFPRSLCREKVIYGKLEGQAGQQTRIHWPISAQGLHQPLQKWSQLFSDFYSECRFLGAGQSEARQPDAHQPEAHQPETIAIAQARLGLVYILRAALRFLLLDVLGIDAPQAL